jgi:hypothetical protein
MAFGRIFAAHSFHFNSIGATVTTLRRASLVHGFRRPDQGFDGTQPTLTQFRRWCRRRAPPARLGLPP